MQKTQKSDSVAEFKEKFLGAQIAIATNFIGVNAAQATDVRKRLRDSDVQFKVYKNTLARRALDELGMSDAIQFLDGPTAWAFSSDPVTPAKILKEANKDIPIVEMRGGMLEGQVVSKAQLESLASLPPREVLLAQVVGTMAMPLRNFVSVMAAPARNFVNVIDQIRKQKEEGQAA